MIATQYTIKFHQNGKDIKTHATLSSPEVDTIETAWATGNDHPLFDGVDYPDVMMRIESEEVWVPDQMTRTRKPFTGHFTHSK